MRHTFTAILASALLLVFSTVNLAKEPTQYGPTQPNDRLWRIALKTRPSNDITPQQMMAAYLHDNPNAFKDHNVNGLYSGITLRVPNLATIRTLSSGAALQLMVEQNSQWQPPAEQMAALPAIAVSDQRMQALALKMATIMQHTHQAFAQMDEDQSLLRKQLVTMSVRVNQLSDALDQQQLMITHMGTSNNTTHQAWQQQLREYVIIACSVGLTLFVLLIATWIQLVKQHRLIQQYAQQQAQTQITTSDEDDLDDEYDFINSEEGIPAKLDLARAYIDMDDIQSAKEVLQDIIDHGDQAQKQQASHLLSHVTVPQPL